MTKKINTNYKKKKKVSLSTFNKYSKKVTITEHDNNKDNVLFSFQYMDVSRSKWALQSITENESYTLIDKLYHFQNTSWGEISGNHEKNHFIDINAINKNAFKILNSDIYKEIFNDKVFSFRLSGEKRLFGIRNGNVFYIIWYDKNHEICQSNKKHT